MGANLQGYSILIYMYTYADVENESLQMNGIQVG